MSRKQEVRRYLRRTTEVKLLLRNTAIYLGINLVLAGVFFLNLRVWQASVLLPALWFVPYLVWFGIRYGRIMAKPESYCFYRAKLDLPRCIGGKPPRYYFILALDEGDGTHTVVNSHALFSSHGLFWPDMESCLNQDVAVAYNPETKMVVLAG